MEILSSKFTEKDLMVLKKKIDDGKSKIAEIKGKQNYLLKELAEKWGCKNLKEAEKVLIDIQSKLDDISSKLDVLLAEIASTYSDVAE